MMPGFIQFTGRAIGWRTNQYPLWFETLCYAAKRQGIGDMTALAAALEMPVTTLASKCRRAGLRLPGGVLRSLWLLRGLRVYAAGGSVTDAADAAGYESAHSFRRAVRKETRIPLRVWRTHDFGDAVPVARRAA